MSIRYSERLAEAGIEPSVGSLAETINWLYKVEMISSSGLAHPKVGRVGNAGMGVLVQLRRLLEPIGRHPGGLT